MTSRKKAERPSTESDIAANGKSRGSATCTGAVEPARTFSAKTAAVPAAATIARCPSQTATRAKAADLRLVEPSYSFRAEGRRAQIERCESVGARAAASR